MAGFAYFLGIRMMHASVIRVGNGIPNYNGIQLIVFRLTRSFCTFYLSYELSNTQKSIILIIKNQVSKKSSASENLREEDFS